MSPADARSQVDHSGLYRGILVIAVIMIPAFGLLEWDLTDDSFVARLIFAGIALALVVASFVSERVRRHLRLGLLLFCHALFAWFVFIGWRHRMVPEDILGLLTIIAGATVIMRRVWEAALFVAFVATALAIAYHFLDASVVPLSVSLAILLTFCGVLGWMSVWRTRLEQRVVEQTTDLTQTLAHLQTAQRQLVEAEKMAALGTMVAGIAHEMKNPLNFVNNFADLSLEYVDEIERLAPAFAGNPAGAELMEALSELTDNLRRIREHGQRADATINTMLMHARNRRGEPIELDVNRTLVECTNFAYHGFSATDRAFSVEIVQQLDSSLAPITGPFQDLPRVIVNLVSNACHAMRERQRSGEPGYRATLRIVSCRHAGQVELRVEDNGTGISPEALRRMFDPFFTTKPPGEGTGLGLSLNYEIVVKELGGSIDVASLPGAGATFTVRIPTAES